MVVLVIQGDAGEMQLAGTMQASAVGDGWRAEIALVAGVRNPTWSQVMRRRATIKLETGEAYEGAVIDHIVLFDRYDRVLIRGDGPPPPESA